MTMHIVRVVSIDKHKEICVACKPKHVDIVAQAIANGSARECWVRDKSYWPQCVDNQEPMRIEHVYREWSK